MQGTFEELGLRPELVQAVLDLGYEAPTPIQANAIPTLLSGRDVLGQAQTGTGKTAAFALPLLHNLNTGARGVQALVLTPTRELALQVSEAIYQYGKMMRVQVVAIYGGASYSRQLKRLTQGVHVVVGTPGRVIDLIERGALDLSTVRMLVLDEADEMLKMGFIDDVERILAETPAERQTALFSATLPDDIRRLANQYMHEPAPVTIPAKALTVAQTEQRYYLVREEDKLNALSRLIEAEEMTSVLIFARTKIGTAELAESLLGRGFMAEALHGDLSQDAREVVLRRFRNGQVVFLVATDVVARGIDIPSVSHVINYDVPNDPEDYVHRIGRTGRAGREGVAITLITPREQRWMRTIEQFIKQKINRATLPTADDVLTRREQRFVASLTQLVHSEGLDAEHILIDRLISIGYLPNDLAAAAIRLARTVEGQRPLADITELADRPPRDRERGGERGDRMRGDRQPRERRREAEAGMVRVTLDIGREHGVRPGDIVGAIAGETGIPGKAIGAIDITRERTFLDVQEQYADKVLNYRGGIVLRGKTLTISRAKPARDAGDRGGDRPERGEQRRSNEGERPRRDRGGYEGERTSGYGDGFFKPRRQRSDELN